MEITAQEYLQHKYILPEELPDLPLSDEEFLNQWEEAEGADVLKLLHENFDIDSNNYKWKDESKLKITFASTLGGHLPVIDTYNHDDFLNMEAVLNGRRKLGEYPATVNAFTISAKNLKIYHHRLILLNHAPYSNVPAYKLNLTDEEWLEKSHTLRLYHEYAHYETLRIFGDMKNHALDEILADSMGQIAAFGSFDVQRQMLFFGLEGSQCNGRLKFYCQKVNPNERSLIYQAVTNALNILVDRINAEQNYFDRLCLVACNSISDVLKYDIGKDR